MYRKNAWENYDGEERARLGAFADAYRAFLDRSKTEREAAASAERVCRAAGFQNLDDLIEAGAALMPGESVGVLGPLGHGFGMGYSHPLLVGGGMGLSPLLYVAAAYAGKADVLMGGKTADELFWTELFAPLGGRTFITTDDGSLGTKGFTTTLLPDLLEAKDASYDAVLVCGPEIMMRGVAKIAAAHGLPCEVSLEKRMGCGRGACLSCSIDTAHGRRKVCKDGPVFPAEEVFL